MRVILCLKKFLPLFADGLREGTKTILAGKGKKSKKKAESAELSATNNAVAVVNVTLRFKRYIHDPEKKMVQR